MFSGYSPLRHCICFIEASLVQPEGPRPCNGDGLVSMVFAMVLERLV
jgi:hypothetical protein